MRTLLLLALVVLIGAACSEGSVPSVAAPKDYTTANAQAFEVLMAGPDWEDAGRNAQGLREAVHEKTGLVFVLVPGTGPGGFMMGSPEDEADREDIEKQHRVTVPAFLLSKTECTQRAWDAVGGEDGRHWKGPDLPIETLRWTAAEAWCRKAGLRLPSESEWEYSCRAGTETPFSTGSTLSTVQANYNGKYPYDEGRKGEFRQRTVAAGSLPANPWGLHEMHGNVWEWCQDWHEASYDLTPSDGSAHDNSGYRVDRGGSWLSTDLYCRSAIRSWGSPDRRNLNLGFRPAATLLPR